MLFNIAFALVDFVIYNQMYLNQSMWNIPGLKNDPDRIRNEFLDDLLQNK